MGSWPLIYKKNLVCPQVLLNSLNVRTFAAAIKILLCCETFWTDLFAKLSTAAPTQLGKKNKTRELYCLVNFTSRDWLSRFKFFKGLLFYWREGAEGSGGRKILTKLVPRVFSFSSMAAAVILENEKTPGARLHPRTRRNNKDPNFIFGLASQLWWMKQRLILCKFPSPIKLNQSLG